jgi:hypothetical protein
MKDVIRIRISSVAFLALVFLLPHPSFANSGSGVGGPGVESGKTSVEWRIAGATDDTMSQDERIRTRIHIDHAFNEIYAARLVVSADKRQGNDTEHEGVSLQNRFHLLHAKEHGLDAGIRLNYTYGDGDKKPDIVSFRLLELIPLGKWEIRFNQIFDAEVGEDRSPGLLAEWRSQVTYKMTDNVRLGLDLFHDLGNLSEQAGYSAQEHALGPVVKAKLGGGYSFEAAFRHGVSLAAPNDTLTLIFSKTW